MLCDRHGFRRKLKHEPNVSFYTCRGFWKNVMCPAQVCLSLKGYLGQGLVVSRETHPRARYKTNEFFSFHNLMFYVSFGGVFGLWTLSFGLLQFHGLGSWLVCEAALKQSLKCGIWYENTLKIHTYTQSKASCIKIKFRTWWWIHRDKRECKFPQLKRWLCLVPISTSLQEARGRRE